MHFSCESLLILIEYVYMCSSKSVSFVDAQSMAATMILPKIMHRLLVGDVTIIIIIAKYSMMVHYFTEKHFYSSVATNFGFFCVQILSLIISVLHIYIYYYYPHR